MAKRNRKKAKRKAQSKRRKARAKEEQRKPQIQTNPDLPELPGFKAPNIKVHSDNTNMLFTHEKAYEYCDLPIFEGERPISDRHVQSLYDKMRRRLFNFRLVILSSAIFDDQRFKINGQHTSWAYVNLTPEEVAELYGEVFVREVIYKVDSAADMKSLYSQYDAGMIRSEGHLTKVQLIGESSVSGISTNNLNPLVSGLKMWLFESKHERQRYGSEEVVVLVDKHKDVFQLVATVLQDNKENAKLIRRQPVIAAMFATFSKVPTKARGFWQPVADGIGFESKTDPRYKLRQTLQDAVLNVTSSSKKPTAPEDLFRMAILAWNKWRKDESAQASLRTTKRRVLPS
jgi:hypothetical protein